MTLEEAIAAIAALQKKADDADAAIAALKAKNAEIITEKKELRDKFNAFKEEVEAKGKAPTPNDPPESPTAKALRERIEAEYGPKLTALTSQLDAITNERNTLAVETALDDALKTAGVAVHLQPAVKALLKTSRKIELANGVVTCDGKAVKDSVSEWVATPEGKAFVAAPANGGSAAPGGASGAITKKRSELTASEKGAFITAHGLQAYQQLPL